MDPTNYIAFAGLAGANILLGFILGRLRRRIATAQLIREAKDEAWRTIEDQQLDTLRHKAHALGLCPESMAGRSWEQAPPMPADFRHFTR